MAETSENQINDNEKLDKFDKLKFDNVYGELDFFKKKCEILEKDLFKTQTSNKKNDSIIKKLQDMIAIYGKNTNNTSNSYLLPSEFKSNWESLIKDQIMEAFENSFSDYLLLTYLVQDTIKIIYNESIIAIKQKISNILKALNINDSNNKNIDNISYDKFICKFRLIFQEYFSNIFQNNSEFLENIKNKLNSLIDKNDEIYKNFTDKINLIKQDVSSKSFTEFLISAFKLCLYMHLHEPKLTFILPSASEERKLIFSYYKKDDFTNIEGFPKEKSCCVIILPCPILRSNYSYQGIKPAVYIISCPTEDIIEECNKNINNSTKIKSVSSIDLVNLAQNNNLNEIKAVVDTEDKMENVEKLVTSSKKKVIINEEIEITENNKNNLSIAKIIESNENNIQENNLNVGNINSKFLKGNDINENFNSNINNSITNNNLLKNNSNVLIVNNIPKYGKDNHNSYNQSNSHKIPTYQNTSKNNSQAATPIQHKNSPRTKNETQKNSYFDHPLSINRCNLNDSNLNNSKINNNSNYLDSNRNSTTSYLTNNNINKNLLINNSENISNNSNNNPRQYNNNNYINNYTNDAMKLIDAKNYRSNSHNFNVNHSRNSSAIDNLNNSFSKDIGKNKEISLNTNNNLKKSQNYIKNEFIKPENINYPNKICDNPNIPNTEIFTEKTINLIKPFTNIKHDRDINITNSSIKESFVNEKENDYSSAFRQEFGKSYTMNSKISAVREEIKITSIHVNLNQMGKTNINNFLEIEKNKDRNLPLKQKSISEDRSSKDNNLNLSNTVFSRISNNKNNNYINLEYINLSRKKNLDSEIEGKNINLNPLNNNLNLTDCINTPQFDANKKEIESEVITRGNCNTVGPGDNYIDTLTIQQNERKMNNKKKGSNPNLNNFINTNFMSNNNNFNSAKKIENSPVKFSNQINNVNLTMKPKRQLDNLINNNNFPSSNNENSENFLKNNFNNIDFLALTNKNDEEPNIKNEEFPYNPTNQGCFMYIPKRDPSNSNKYSEKTFYNPHKFKESMQNSVVNSQVNTESNCIITNTNLLNENNSSRIQTKNNNSILGNNVSNTNNFMLNNNTNFYNDINYNGLKSGDFHSKLSNKFEKYKERENSHSNFDNLGYNPNNQSNLIVNEFAAKKNSSMIQNKLENKNKSDKNYKNVLNNSPKNNNSMNTFFNLSEKSQHKENNTTSHGLTYKERMKNLKSNANNINNNYNSNNSISNQNSNFESNNNLYNSNFQNSNSNKLFINSNNPTGGQKKK